MAFRLCNCVLIIVLFLKVPIFSILFLLSHIVKFLTFVNSCIVEELCVHSIYKSFVHDPDQFVFCILQLLCCELQRLAILVGLHSFIELPVKEALIGFLLNHLILLLKLGLILLRIQPLKRNISNHAGIRLDIAIPLKPCNIHVIQKRLPHLDLLFGEIFTLFYQLAQLFVSSISDCLGISLLIYFILKVFTVIGGCSGVVDRFLHLGDSGNGLVYSLLCV